MPQMSPLNWLTLMFFFLIFLFMINLMIYNSFLKITNKIKKNNFMLLKNWKW